MARAVAVFGEEARLQTTGVADIGSTIPGRPAGATPPSTEAPFVLDEVVGNEAAPAALVEETVPDDQPRTPSEAVLAYAKMLQRLEHRKS
jgi:hypothetical protein